MKKKAKVFTWICVGILGTGAAIGGVLVWKYIKRNGPKDLGSYQVINANSEKGWNFNFKWYKNSQGNEFLTKAGYEQLDAYLTKYLYYGPESQSLKRIIFGDRNIIGADASGLYYGSTREIFINIETYIGTKNLTQQQKITSISEVIAHEYGHHFAHIYLKGYKENKTYVPTERTYDPSGHPVIWNKKYLDEWKALNRYNSMDTNDQYHITNGKEEYTNLNSKVSLNSLYRMANKDDEGLFPIDGKGYYWGGKASIKDKILPLTFINNAKNRKNLKYYYSADEQFTRSVEMFMWPKNYFKKGSTEINIDSEYFIPRSNIGSAAHLWSPQAYDLAHVKDINPWKNDGANGNISYPNYPFGGNLYAGTESKKTSIAPYASDYYKYLLNVMNYGSQISHIYTKNTGEIVRGTTGNIEVKNENPENTDNIKLSGYSKGEWTNIAVVNNSSKKIVVNEKLISNKFSGEDQNSLFHYFGRKTMDTQFDTSTSTISPYGNQNWLKPTTSYYTYIMKNFMDMNKLKGTNYSLYFNNKPDAHNLSALADDKIIINQVKNNGNELAPNYLDTYQEYDGKLLLYWKLNFTNKKELVVSKTY